MPRRAPRAPFVVTFALGATAVAGGCGNGSVIYNNPPGISPDGSNGDGSAACPAQMPAPGGSCDLPSTASCAYGDCNGFTNDMAVCEDGGWRVSFGSCNPPGQIQEAGPDVVDAAPDGEGQDGGHIGDATGDVAPDAGSD